ncbi:hypothetical protein [Neobacillus piezotolerans]|uniref:hypothetical protein n=1 Tax=Neobacillus piezotolerans TaxID=2259171 RepID=UPI00115BC4B7|nr:hypothetical protein [Neobacillus piezotolerans]
MKHADISPVSLFEKSAGPFPASLFKVGKIFGKGLWMVNDRFRNGFINIQKSGIMGEIGKKRVSKWVLGKTRFCC